MHRKLERLVDVNEVLDLGTVKDGRLLADRLRDVLYLEGISEKELNSVIDYVGNDISEKKVRGAIHLLMSTPHFQLC
jgi:hypothetical protein